MKNDTEKRAQNRRTGRAVGVVAILLIMLALRFPNALFFLNPAQREAIKLFDRTYFGSFMPLHSEDGSFDFMRLVALIFMIAACWAVYRTVMWIISLFRTENRHMQTLLGLLANVCRYAIVIFAIIFGLNILGADILTVIAGIGILALIVGFGAQSLIEDIFAGLLILFEGRFYVGDIINVDDFRGTVRSIGIVSTQIADVGGNIRIINNSDIRNMTNLSDVSSAAVSIVGISYSADLLKAEAVVNELLDQLPGRYPQLFPVRPVYMGVENLGESSVDLKIVADVHETNIYQARRVLNRELKLALDAGGIEIPFPQIVVWQGKES